MLLKYLKVFEFLQFFLIFFIATNQTNGQRPSEISGFITNKSEEPIPYCLIINDRTQIGHLSDSLGRFVISGIPSDKVIFKQLSFLTLETSIQSLQLDNRIQLVESPIALNKIEILPTRIDDIERVGISRKSRIIKNYYLLKPGFGDGIAIINKRSIVKKIKSVNVKVGFKGSPILPFRINLWSLNEDNFPENILGNKDIIIYPKDKLTWENIDLIDQNIVFEGNGIGVSIEPLAPSTLKVKFSKKYTPLVGVYNCSENCVGLQNRKYALWFKPVGKFNCPAVYLELIDI
ncbi:hypothetical protein SAMN06298216_1201 [Spirosomataceae bacterium TFI 002]|nr:hypothetical protein SAMN06298216_1201 [Spirosomataceae bacterium TFI 002]